MMTFQLTIFLNGDFFNSLHIWFDSTIMTSFLSVLFYQKYRLWAWLEYQNPEIIYENVKLPFYLSAKDMEEQ